MTGFKARMGLYELLTVTDGFKAKVTADPSIDALRRQAIVDGMRPLRLAGALRMAEGQTVIEEVLTSTPPQIESPKAFQLTSKATIGALSASISQPIDSWP